MLLVWGSGLALMSRRVWLDGTVAGLEGLELLEHVGVDQDVALRGQSANALVDQLLGHLVGARKLALE